VKVKGIGYNMKRSLGGRVDSLYVNRAHRTPSLEVEEVDLVEGFGIEGDIHYSDRLNRKEFQVLLIDAEVLDNLQIPYGAVKENITVRGFEIFSLLPGQKLAVGNDVILQISKICLPCSRMEDIRLGLEKDLIGKRGMLASVIKGGSIRVGDNITFSEM
jgi:hypothetical protein